METSIKQIISTLNDSNFAFLLGRLSNQISHDDVNRCIDLLRMKTASDAFQALKEIIKKQNITLDVKDSRLFCDIEIGIRFQTGFDDGIITSDFLENPNVSLKARDERVRVNIRLFLVLLILLGNGPAINNKNDFVIFALTDLSNMSSKEYYENLKIFLKDNKIELNGLLKQIIDAIETDVEIITSYAP